jgi:hypothetical protein
MELNAKLSDLKKRIMKKIAEAATKHDTQSITAYSGIANRIEQDEHALAMLGKRVNDYETVLNHPMPTSHQQKIEIIETTTDLKRIKGREGGLNGRKRFVGAGPNRGYQLTHLGKSIYRTARGKKVGLTFANENDQKPGAWWLGTPDSKYDIVVLLCQQDDGEALEFIIAQQDLEKFWGLLSRSAGQVKFNIVRDGANYYLLIPGHGRESINRFLGFYGPLKD